MEWDSRSEAGSSEWLLELPLATAISATAKRTLRDAREKRHQVRCHVLATLSNRSDAIVPTGGRNEHASSAAVHTELHSVQKSKGTAKLLWLCTESGMFAREALEKGKALIDCSAAVGGTGRIGTHERVKETCGVLFSRIVKKTQQFLQVDP